MTVSATQPIVSYDGDATTDVFAVPFTFVDTADLVVTLTDEDGVDTELTEVTDYTVAGGEGATGTVTLDTPPAVDEVLTITRYTARVQGTDYQQNDLLPAEQIEADLDRLTRIVQEIDEDLATGLGYADLLPAPAANMLLIGNGAGTAWVNTAIADLALASIPVSLAGLASGDVLQYNGSIWTNVAGGAFSNPMTTNGDLITRTAGVPARLGIGAANTVLKSDGSAAAWGSIVNANIDASAAIALTKLASVADLRIIANISGGVAAPLANTLSGILDAFMAGAANGDMIIRTGGVWTRLAIGTNGQVLSVVGGLPAWATPASVGGLVVVDAQTVTVAQASITKTGISGYRELIIIYDVACAVDASELRFKLVKSASTVIDNTTHTALAVTGGASFAEAEANAPLDLDGGSFAIPNTANSGRCAGVIVITDLTSAAYKTVVGMANVGGVGMNMFGGQVQDTAAITGTQFVAASGNVTGRAVVLGVPA